MKLEEIQAIEDESSEDKDRNDVLTLVTLDM